MTTIPTAAQLFALEALDPILRTLVEDADRPWHILSRLDDFVASVQDDRQGEVHPSAVVTGPVYLAPGARIGPCALVEGPAWIGSGAHVGHAAYVRGGAVLGAGAKVGHCSEVKRSVLLHDAKAPHFNYLGDAIVGRGVNLGAGVKLANFHTFEGTIKVAGEDTGLRKFSAALGDGVSIGCNAVLAPGTIVGARTVVYSGAMVRGVYEADRVVKLRQGLEPTPRHTS